MNYSHAMCGILTIQAESGVSLAKIAGKVEADWIEEARCGSREALGCLYELYSQRIYAYAYVRLQDQTEAEDATSQIFLKMVEKIRDYKVQGSGFPAWLFRIAHNQIIDMQRGASRRQNTSLDSANDLLASDSTDPYKLAERRDFLDLLKGCMVHLSDLQAQVITLRYTGELSNIEIATVISRTTNSVNSLHYEALKKLEKLLTEKGYTF